MKNISKQNWENEEYRIKISEATKKNWENEEFRENHSERLSVRNKKNWENIDYREKMEEVLYQATLRNWENEEFRENFENKNRYGISGIFISNNLYFASSYEAVVIYKYLQQGKNIQRCPTKFRIKMNEEKKQHYYPDFYIPEDNLIIEVKPKYKLTNPKFKYEQQKINKAKEEFSLNGINYLVLTEEEIFKNKEDDYIFKMLKENNLIKIYER